ncbi:winged helix-turn-helix domain-containing protein [Candidatus Frankia nodulisporulans]|uniref:winged helix-turn-helix domain-containing protein n=1 Tax=Candidatus Frankia nodulisporulans TaxID=2060052 RepID=UPI001CDD2BE8
MTSYRRRSHLPEPDQTIGRTPVWRPARIVAWHASRPRPHTDGRAVPTARVQVLESSLREAIRAGRHPEGEKLRSERQLAAEHGVGRTTVRSILTRLEADGLITARQGLGYFVAEDRSSGEPIPEPAGSAGVEVSHAGAERPDDL